MRRRRLGWDSLDCQVCGFGEEVNGQDARLGIEQMDMSSLDKPWKEGTSSGDELKVKVE